MKLKYIYILSALLFTAQAGKAQYVKNQQVKDQQGRPMQMGEYVNVQGHPYLFDKWTSGLVRFNNGVVVTDAELKYDIVKDLLCYKDPKTEQIMTFNLHPQEFSIDVPEGGGESLIFRCGFQPLERNSPANYYQLLANGKVQLLKRIIKEPFEEQPYNSATKIRTFKDSETYYLAKNNQPAKVKKDKKSILAALGDKTAELEAFIKTDGLNLKNEKDLAKLILYYNSL